MMPNAYSSPSIWFLSYYSPASLALPTSCGGLDDTYVHAE